MHSSQRGFTLIELLVVIAIIGILSGVVLVTLNQVRMDARNSQRIQDMNNVAKAIAIYALDNNGVAPAPGGTACATSQCMKNIADDLVPTYISALPEDPRFPYSDSPANVNFSYRYCRVATATSRYDLMFRVERSDGTVNWCNVRHANRPLDGEAGCLLGTPFASGGSPYGWCEDQI